ncbi:MAG: NAD(P)H-dependent oxidoreductase [Methanomicrobiales archaeon]|nr:NAD(P)H-dependent oxidoreductase [Methanomicrobiales archaeon]
MNICYIYHSETGNTRGIADRCLAATGGDRIEVYDLQHYNKITKFLVGGRRAGKGLSDPIEPSTIDASKYDLMVIGSPVWGGKPTPAINAAIQALKGCEGKKGVLFVTCGGSPGESLFLMRKALEGRRVTIAASMSFTRKELRDDSRLNDFIQQITSVVAG